jgi:hypothetical protein
MCIPKEGIGPLKLICAMNVTDRSFRVWTFLAERCLAERWRFKYARASATMIGLYVP